MTTPALQWVDSIQVGNATAKALLRFLASQNFQTPGFFFKNATYMAALEISEKTLQRAFDHLENGKFITCKTRFDSNGRQMTNVIYLNVPEQFLHDYEERIQNSVKSPPKNIPRQNDHPRGVNLTGGGRQFDAPYNNNINNNINNKYLYGQKTGFPVENHCKKEAVPKFNKKHQQKSGAISCNFTPTEEHQDLAFDLDLDLNREKQKFIDHFIATAAKRHDWNAAFRNWMRNAYEIIKERSSDKKVSNYNATSYIQNQMKKMGLKNDAFTGRTYEQ